MTSAYRAIRTGVRVAVMSIAILLCTIGFLGAVLIELSILNGVFK